MYIRIIHHTLTITTSVYQYQCITEIVQLVKGSTLSGMFVTAVRLPIYYGKCIYDRTEEQRTGMLQQYVIQGEAYVKFFVYGTDNSSVNHHCILLGNALMSNRDLCITHVYTPTGCYIDKSWMSRVWLQDCMARHKEISHQILLNMGGSKVQRVIKAD